jgi:hypothetical protein
MKPEILQKLSEARDFYALTKGILALCEPFGAVHAFRFVHNRGAATVACFVELESSKQQPMLARALGTRTLNGEVCLEIPVRKDFGGGQGKVVALATPASGFDPRLAPPSAAQAASSPASR